MLGTTKDVQRFKISFHFYAAKPETVAMIERLASSIFPNHYTIICEEIGYNRGLPAKTSIRKYCLDVVAATKSTAVRYISTLTGVSEGIVAGDSGNDVDMLLENSKFHAVLVGGATSEAVSEIEKRLASKTKGSVYKMVGRNGTTKSCYVERDPKRMGPESIIEAVKALAQ
ncbi:MAG: Sucrose-6F-phosphate phosphohydrolase [bacterium ADurb.Bin400]|nr:MAG: Sucrose-6F-phosphate phosphohydrolase [bacterium ADurb.Bin400]